MKWYNEGEKNTKYFHSLEKRHFNNKAIRYLKIENDKKISTDSTTNSADVNDYDNIFFPEVKLSHNQKESGEGLLSATECFESLKKMESVTSPGTDGIPAEFIKCFGTICLPFCSSL